jgi:carbonic anhydrase
MAEGQFHMLSASDLTLEIPDQAGGAEFENLGTTVEVVLEGKGGKMALAGVEYELKQFHIHHPSEHLDNGTSVESAFLSFFFLSTYLYCSQLPSPNVVHEYI